MIIPFTQVDAFIVDGKPLTGNPAAVMILDDWLPDDVLQAIAVENNLSETAFLKTSDGEADWDLRWFTPGTEVDLCGHATLASGHAVIGDADRATFDTRSGILTVSRDGDRLVLDAPATTGIEALDDPALIEALGVVPTEVHRVLGAEDSLLIVLENEAAVRACAPNFQALMPYPELVIITAPGDHYDVTSRVFAVSFAINEDPVTGAAHAALAPYWAHRLGRSSFSALQASARSGELSVELKDGRALIGGQCATVIEGEFRL